MRNTRLLTLGLSLVVAMLIAVPAGAQCPMVAPISPTGSVIESSPVTFQWAADMYATTYHLIVENASTFMVVFDDSTITTTSLTVALPDGYYYWRVHAVDGPCGEIDTTPVYFQVSTAPACPVIGTLSPAPNADVTPPVTFQWTPDAGASSYHLIIENASTSTVVFDDSSIASAFHTVSLPDGMYYWRVHAVGGPCAEIDTPFVPFTVTTPISCPTTAPTLTSPANGTMNLRSPVSFSWTAVPDATSYQLFVASNGGTATSVGSTSGTSLSTTLPDGSHQWYVVAKAESCQDRTSSTFSFTVFSGPAPVVTNFEASPARIRRGSAAQLVWTTENATGVTISEGVGSHGTSGSAEVSPQSTTTYSLTATGPGGSTTAQAVIEVFVQPEVVLTALPAPIVQEVGSGVGSTSYILTNVGGSASNVSLSKTGDFFTQEPTSFALQSGASQTISIIGLPVAAGIHRGRSTVQGDGVPSGLSVQVELLASEPPGQGNAIVEPVNNRIDVNGAPGTNPTGTAFFRNVGNAPAVGFVIGRRPWIIPDPDLITIEPCGDRCGDSSTWVGVPFSIDRSQRPDSAAPIGSVTGIMEFVFQTGSSGKTAGKSPNQASGGAPSLVTIVDTSKPPVAPGQIPPLAQGENAFFISGVGHVLGSVGLFLSDVTLVNLSGTGSLSDINMFYTPIGGTGATPQSSTVSGLAAANPLALADVVSSVFENDAQIGSLQFRSSDLRKLSINANILNVSNPKGTFGTTIPVLRSDRSAGPGFSVYLAGLRKSSTAHTNIFLQETAGGSVTVNARFFSQAGVQLGTKTYSMGPFQLFGDFFSQSNPVLPDGAVTAILTCDLGSTGRFSAYATPVDEASGDFWSVVDWNQQFQYDGTGTMLIPVAGRLVGAGNTFFRTDVAIVNRGSGTAVGLLRYYPREGGAPIDNTISLETNQSAVFDDVISTLLAFEQDTVGYMTFAPQSGSFGLTSRTFSSEIGSVASFGTGVPTLAVESSIRLGSTLKIGGIDDASLASVGNAVPGSFRSNFAIVETGGADVLVRATLHYDFAAASSLAASRGTASKDYLVGANQFLLLSNIANQILGAERASFGDLTNLQIDFTVIGGTGAAAFFVSSVDNGTGDQILRTE